MKKLTLLTTGMLLAAFTFGQVGNTSVHDIDGNDNTSTTEQLGNYNDALIVQEGDDNIADQYSSGDENTATIEQEGDLHQAYQTQSGYKNTAISRSGFHFTTPPYADEMYTYQEQDGDENQSTFEMERGVASSGYSYQYGDRNRAFLRVRGDDNIADIYQDGDDNRSTAYQFGKLNDVYTDQIGDWNKSTILQNRGNGSNNAWAEVLQTGDRNSSKIYQGWGWHNTVLVEQVDNGGIGNTSAIEQNGTSNYADILQRGHGNVLHNSKHGSYDPEFAFQRGASTLYLHQQGYDNDAGVYQDYSQQYGDIYQYGYRNHADLTQKSGQPGQSNSATISQYGTHSLGWGKDNWSEVYQTGSDNTAVIDIEGDYNGYGTTGTLWTDIRQDGDENDAMMTIKGNANDADIFQIGNLNTATVNVTGNYNISTTTQH